MEGKLKEIIKTVVETFKRELKGETGEESRPE